MLIGARLLITFSVTNINGIIAGVYEHSLLFGIYCLQLNTEQTDLYEA